MEKIFTHLGVRESLFSHADPQYKQFNKKLIPHIDEREMIGVRTPVLRMLAKKIANANWRYFLQESWDFAHAQGSDVLYFEEKMLHSFILGAVKNTELDELFHYIKYHIRYLDSWAAVDSFASSLKIAKKSPLHENYLKGFLEPYFYLPNIEQNEYQVRFALVMLHTSFIKKDNLDYIFDRVSKVKHSAYYVKMAKAWLLSICFVHFPNETKQVLFDEKNPLALDEWTLKKTMQKIRESKRCTTEDRAFLNEKAKNLF